MKRTLMIGSSDATRKILFTALLVLFAAFSVFDRPASAAVTDTTPPVLKDFSFAPPSVDVTNGAATVTVNLHVTDDLSGTSSNIIVIFHSPSGGQTADCCYSDRRDRSRRSVSGNHDDTKVQRGGDLGC